jgi:hypothetical protein
MHQNCHVLQSLLGHDYANGPIYHGAFWNSTTPPLVPSPLVEVMMWQTLYSSF